VRPLDKRLGKVPNVSSAALTEKGDPILILDVVDMLQAAANLSAKLSTGKAVSSTAFATTAPLDAEPLDISSSSVSKVKKVLVVDDSLTVRAMEKKVLQNHGYQVDVAVNGAEGWNAVRMNTYDLVITDIDMPRMNGIELIEQMRAYRSTQHLPVIVVSYKDREADQLAGLEAGANYYLTKSSFHNDGLITAVVDLIGAAI
ncbi:MAG: response regulator, partial [Cyanobacteria bacterium J06554_3]